MAFGHADLGQGYSLAEMACFGPFLDPNARLCRKGGPKRPFSTFSFAFDSHVFNMRFRINGDI